MFWSSLILNIQFNHATSTINWEGSEIKQNSEQYVSIQQTLEQYVRLRTSNK